ncbi:MAG: hypothetical protein EBS56_03970 [Planctomycetia bacterium]|nr:hypothetical protein [Planctomycetia bacterium]
MRPPGGRWSAGRWRRLLGGAATGVVASLLAIGFLLKHDPAPPAAAPGPAADRAAARLVTKAAALHAAAGRDGAWGASLTDSEVNAWLATDLPRNHPGLLPRGLAEPRLRFRPQRIEAAVRTGSGLFSAVVSCVLTVRLRGVNQLALEAESAAVGAVPLPSGPVLAELGRRLAAAGATTELRRLDGRTVLVVYIAPLRTAPGIECRLESLRIDDRELVVAGTTRDRAADRQRTEAIDDGP